MKIHDHAAAMPLATDVTPAALHGVMQTIEQRDHAKLIRSRLRSLSGRQLSIIQWLAWGKQQNEIDGILGLSVSVIKADVHNALNATGCSTAASLVALAVREGFVK